MWNMIWPIALVVFANAVYNICAKSTPAGAHAFLSLTVTYLVAAGITAALFLADRSAGPLVSEVKNLNWTAPVLGLAIVGLEFGYLCIYRAGWPVRRSSAALTTPAATPRRPACAAAMCSLPLKRGRVCK